MPAIDPADIGYAIQLAELLVSIFKGNHDPAQVQKAIDEGNAFLARKANPTLTASTSNDGGQTWQTDDGA